jgi:MoaA/NifB/PqqE/SkfB family radical SAM enzyme
MLNMVRMQLPFLLPAARTPPTVSIELTNYCNLSCSYCYSPLKLRPQGLMSEATFGRLVDQLHALKSPWVYVVGLGEPTLHPQFASFIRRLRPVAGFLQLGSNLQRMSEGVVESIFDAPVDQITISVDGATREAYEQSRLGGSFERLMANLAALVERKRAYGSSLLVNIRIMLRPSQEADQEEMERFWKPYGDTINVLHLGDFGTGDPDTYPVRLPGVFPRCTLTLREIEVRWNGDVPLCNRSDRQTGIPEGVLLGNINTNTILDLWSHPLMRQYRVAHRARDEENIPICNGCRGHWSVAHPLPLVRRPAPK